MMKSLKFCLGACAILAAGAVWADTPIPNGYAIYDVTFNFTEFPEINDYGNWPVVVETLLGQSILAERISVDPGKTQIVGRAIMDIKSMIEYSKTEAYTKRTNYQMSLGYFNSYFDFDRGGESSSGKVVGWNSSRSFNGVTTVEGFANVIGGGLSGKECNITASYTYGGSGTTSTFKSMTMKLIRKINNDPLPNEERNYNVSIAFNNPLSVKGFASVDKITIYFPNLFSFSMENPVALEDGTVYEATVKMDVLEMIAKINSDEYQAIGGGQPKIAVVGKDSNGATKTNNNLVTGQNAKVAKMSGSDEFALTRTIRGFFLFRDRPSTVRASDARVIDFNILRRPPGLMLLVR